MLKKKASSMTLLDSRLSNKVAPVALLCKHQNKDTLEAEASRFLRNHFLQKDIESKRNKQLFFVGILPEDTGEVSYYKEGVNFNEN